MDTHENLRTKYAHRVLHIDQAGIDQLNNSSSPVDEWRRNWRLATEFMHLRLDPNQPIQALAEHPLWLAEQTAMRDDTQRLAEIIGRYQQASTAWKEAR